MKLPGTELSSKTASLGSGFGHDQDAPEVNASADIVGCISRAIAVYVDFAC